MKPIERQKLCPSCEGSIPLDAQLCPFCASDLSQEKVKNSFQTPLFENQSLQESLTSLYTPPYSGKKNSSSPFETEAVAQPAAATTSAYKDVTELSSRNSTEEAFAAATVKENSEAKSSLWTTLFMVLGSNLFILGLMQFFFSDNGIVKLEWDGSYWYFYCLLALPFLFFGIRQIKDLD